MSGPGEVILWGQSQVGKTSALAAYFWNAMPEWVDRTDPATQDTIEKLGRIYRTLQRNRLPDGTVSVQSYPLRHALRGVELRFRDMRGEDSGEPSAEQVQAIRSAAAVIVFVSWPGESDVQRWIAARTPLLHLVHGTPCVLVVTKVETHLTRSELSACMLDDPVDEARRRQLPEQFVQLLGSFPRQAIFFISAFGYLDDGMPAQYLDEFGRVVPSGISPVNVQMPFDYVVKEVTCTKGV
jgi:hypothetical protein